MGRLEELKLKYPIKTVAPYGECVIVPGAEFDPDWEAELDDQGIKVFLGTFDQRPATFVQIKKLAAGLATPNEEKPTVPGSDADFPWSDEDEKKLLQRMNELEGTVYERAELLMPEFQGRSAVALRQKFYKLTGLKGSSKRKGRPKPEFLHVPWSAKDDDLLVELWNKRIKNKLMKTSAIAEKLPGRSVEAVKNRIGALQDLKRIKPRWKQKTKIPEGKAEKEPKGPLGSEPRSPQVHERMRNASEDLAIQKLVQTLDALIDIVDKLSCNAVMHALEIREIKGKDDFKIPLGLWTAYSNALLEGDKKYRDVFRDKVRKLLEASE
jgi:hypothetical protein